MVSLTDPKRRHFFSHAWGKSKEHSPKSLSLPKSCGRIGFSDESGRRYQTEAHLFSDALRIMLSDRYSPPATAEAAESPAALVQAYFLAKAWVSESVSACVQAWPLV